MSQNEEDNLVQNIRQSFSGLAEATVQVLTVSGYISAGLSLLAKFGGDQGCYSDWTSFHNVCPGFSQFLAPY